jgi:type IV pilus assembly protein PilN
MRITINLATRPFTDLGPIFKRLRIAMIVFAVVSIGLGIGLHALHSKAQAARARERALDNQIARINNERQGYMALMRQPDNAGVLEQAGTLNQLFDQKAFSWTLAMEDLETVLPGGVQVTTLEPIRDKEGRITLRLRVVGPRDKAVELVQNLEHSRHFLRPSIVGESSESTGGPGTPLEPVSASNKVNFDLLAEYNPATIGEKPTVLKTAPEEQQDSGAVSPAPAPAPVHHAASPSAAGPGLRRPPFTGVSHPPQPVAQPGAARPQPAVPNPQAAPKPRAGAPQ